MRVKNEELRNVCSASSRTSWVYGQASLFPYGMFWFTVSYFVSSGIVVEDCLLLLQNLLKNNNSNQNFFKEGSYIQRMKPWFEVGDDNCGWSAQKVTNLHLMLQVRCYYNS